MKVCFSFDEHLLLVLYLYKYKRCYETVIWIWDQKEQKIMLLHHYAWVQQVLLKWLKQVTALFFLNSSIFLRFVITLKEKKKYVRNPVTSQTF